MVLFQQHGDLVGGISGLLWRALESMLHLSIGRSNELMPIKATAVVGVVDTDNCSPEASNVDRTTYLIVQRILVLTSSKDDPSQYAFSV